MPVALLVSWIGECGDAHLGNNSCYISRLREMSTFTLTNADNS